MTKKLKTRVWDAAKNLDSEGDVNLMKPNPGGCISGKRQGLTPAGRPQRARPQRALQGLTPAGSDPSGLTPGFSGDSSGEFFKMKPKHTRAVSAVFAPRRP
jgi:hypothetical protein